MEKAKELNSRKEHLINDLTLLCEFFHETKQRDSNMVRAKYERVKNLEQECYNLFAEITSYNSTRTNPKEELSMKERNKIIDMVDVIRAAFMKFQDDCKQKNENQNQTTGKHSLRKIQLPYFEGSIEGWLEFKTLFDSLVHNNSNITIEEKFQYLKIHLRKSAAAVIAEYTLEDKYYQSAYDALVQRYHSPRRILNYYLQLLVKYKSSHPFNPQRFLNVHEAAVNALKSLNVDDLADFMLFQLSYNNLDETHAQSLDLKLGDSNAVPSVKNLLDFVKLIVKNEELKHDIQTKTSGHFTKINAEIDQHKKQRKFQGNRCSFCNGEHFLAHCNIFKEKALPQKIEFITKSKLCTNCLGPHPLKECWSTKTCRFCKGKHHSWLHVQSPSKGSGPSETTPFSLSSNHLSQSDQRVLLATAIILIKTESGYQRVRALVDPGSEASFISEAVVQRFKLSRRASTTFVSGVGDHRSTKTRGHISLEFKSIYNSNVHTTPALILNQLSEYIPPYRSLNNPNLADLQWADDLSSTEPIEIILGAEIYPELILEGVWKSAEGTLLAQATTLGWILSGTATSKRKYLHCCHIDHELLKAVQRFWTIEEPHSSLSPEDKEVENYYQTTTTRNSQGRFIVRLPFKGDPKTLGDSLPAAKRSYTFLQRKLQRSYELKNLYQNFMLEYQQLNQMERISSADISPVHYFLPHHIVLRPSSITTKLRVVFNASKPTSSGVSLNDILHVGPQLLPTLQDIILRWRRHKVVFSADIEKMYRQILVHDTDQNFQLICCSSNNEEQFFRLKTITYGTACAPYLAIRTLHQLAEEEKDLPRAAEIIKTETYMDDVLSGANSVSEALTAANELIELLRRGGFPLQKWSTNSSELEAYLPRALPATIEQHCISSKFHSMLGLKWTPQKDLLIIESNLQSSPLPKTKRGVLSSIAKLFDPLGYAAPTLIQAKIFLQSLWLTKLSWDDALPYDLMQRWKYLHEELSSLYLEVPRWLGCSSTVSEIEIFGFSDASEQAMAAAIYIACLAPGGKEVHLVGAKTKLAPIKQISLPRLELNAALMLVRLAKKILHALELDSSVRIYMWSDSTTVLSWIHGHPSKWQTYIANRVSEIQTSLPEAKWYYVPSNQNPADCATRGLSSRQLMKFTLWWVGPTWASSDQRSWPDQPELIIGAPEQRKKPSTHHAVQSTSCDDFIKRFSCFLRMMRTTAYCLRVLPTSTYKGPITAEELLKAKYRIIKQVQQEVFKRELKALNSHQSISPNSSLKKLNPILDNSGILRVGGRLKHSLLDPEEKHPIILPYNNHFTTLVVRDAHKRTLHGGVQLTLATLRRNWWILKGRQAVKSVIHSCVTCKRFQASTLYQQMANLPKERIVPSRPFLHTGVDYAGPIQLRTARGRGHKSYKGYIAVFVCFFSRAIHLEAVTDYTSQGFLAAYRRFTSRRGLCATLTSDRGTNFIGAAAELKSLFEGEAYQHVAGTFANEGTIWRFNPPSAPHFGGLWEASVKSIKYHLKRVIGESTLTYEEMTTLLCQIEAILNSRPLQPLSDDPNDTTALTPAHFLVGTSLQAVPDNPDNHSHPRSALAAFRMVESQKQAFWKKWSEEYVQQFQTRNKWYQPTIPVSEGDLVLIKNETTPPTRWPLARVIAVHRGPDCLVRVATLKTASSTTTRPITKLVQILPKENV